jgi:hypothetical protein
MLFRKTIAGHCENNERRRTTSVIKMQEFLQLNQLVHIAKIFLKALKGSAYSLLVEWYFKIWFVNLWYRLRLRHGIAEAVRSSWHGVQ